MRGRERLNGTAGQPVHFLRSIPIWNHAVFLSQQGEILEQGQMKEQS